uniref:Uncharacterized protein n=1 Tax=Utricularia reniformis TaxID=192314 RepID=A0A1Y0B3D6_9LAMI|nr:hypothetical protein AEK19_MT1729 [Utricularia reniformis]ART31908.1 hypothetical protein AEK19_MT1729 [Utricularia reniformis]
MIDSTAPGSSFFPERRHVGTRQSERSNDTIDEKEIAKYIQTLSIFSLYYVMSRRIVAAMLLLMSGVVDMVVG